MTGAATIDGGCLCGQVRFGIAAPPIITVACHCRGCQKLTASAFSLSVAVPADGFAITAGEPVIGALHGVSRHYFCPRCMSWLFTRPSGIDWFLNVRPTMLDTPVYSTPFVETMTIERLAWATTAAVHSFTTFPEPDAYAGLAAAYAEWAAADRA